MTHSSFNELAFLESPSGAVLSYRYQSAKGITKGILLINHGLVDHSGRYARFAAFMADQGFEVYAHDHRGHGHTTADNAMVGRFARHDGDRLVVADLKAMRDYAAAQHPNLPTLLFGHSMGGLIALNYAVSHPADYAALAIYNSNFNPGLAGRFAQVVLRISQFFKGSDVPSIAMAKATFEHWNKTHGDGRTRADWLSHDPAAADAYVNDPLCQFEPSTSMWQDVFKLTFRAPKLLSRIPQACPILLVGGTQDPATNLGKAITWLGGKLRSSGASNVEVTIYEGFRHETLNEVDYERAHNEFLEWAEQAIAPK